MVLGAPTLSEKWSGLSAMREQQFYFLWKPVSLVQEHDE